MKRILSLLSFALLGAAAPAFADSAFFDVIETPYANTVYEGLGEGSYYTIKMKSAGKVYITNFLNNTGSSEQTELLTNPDYGLTKYGYVDSDKVVHEFDFVEENSKTFDYYEYNLYKRIQGLEPDRYYRVGYYLGEFEAGEEIEIYLSTADASVASNSPTGEYISRFGGRQDAADENLSVGQLYFGGIDGTQINFGIIAQGAGEGGGEGGETVGAPLPGGFSIVLVSGLFALGFHFVRRRKTVVA